MNCCSSTGHDTEVVPHKQEHRVPQRTAYKEHKADKVDREETADTGHKAGTAETVDRADLLPSSNGKAQVPCAHEPVYRNAQVDRCHAGRYAADPDL